MLDADSPGKENYPALSFPHLIMPHPVSGWVKGGRGGWLLAGLANEAFAFLALFGLKQAKQK